MGKNNLSLTNFTESIAGILEYNQQMYGEEDLEYKKILQILSKVIHGELTERQQQCIYLRYYKQKNIVEIAEMLNIGASSVSRHIKKAKLRIEKIIGYYIPRFENK